jgi:hypothetical protein
MAGAVDMTLESSTLDTASRWMDATNILHRFTEEWNTEED